MTVKELIKRLRDEDPNAEVMMTCGYGDRHNTLQALPIDDLMEMPIVESGYSDSGLSVDEEASISLPADARTAVCLMR